MNELLVNELLATLGILTTAAAGFTAIHYAKHPPRWWTRRQQRRRREAQARLRLEALERLAIAVDTIATRFANDFTPALDRAAAAIQRFNKSTPNADQPLPESPEISAAAIAAFRVGALAPTTTYGDTAPNRIRDGLAAALPHLPKETRTPEPQPGLGHVVPRVVRTVEELDALPVGSVILDRDGDVWKERGGRWCGYGTATCSSARVQHWAPFTVLFTPTAKEN